MSLNGEAKMSRSVIPFDYEDWFLSEIAEEREKKKTKLIQHDDAWAQPCSKLF